MEEKVIFETHPLDFRVITTYSEHGGYTTTECWDGSESLSVVDTSFEKATKTHQIFCERMRRDFRKILEDADQYALWEEE